METKRHWAWNNYTILQQSKPSDREKYINNECKTDTATVTPANIHDELFIENKKQLLKETKRTTQFANERMPTLQKNGNPFINNNYIEHLDNEANFLRPKNSNFEQ